MIISSQGFGHFTQGLNNQDFGIETPKMLLVLDGCSGAKYSEVGTRLFAQIFTKREGFDNPETFEDNVKAVFDELISMMKVYYPSDESFETDFIMENLLFTIIACFKKEDKYIVKLFGDGYIITKNSLGKISYLKFSYGKFPPYYAYKYSSNTEFKNYKFKTFEFEMKFFKSVGIASDGILPFVKGDVSGLDKFIAIENKIAIETSIQGQRQKFFDDVTIGIFENL